MIRYKSYTFLRCGAPSAEYGDETKAESVNLPAYQVIGIWRYSQMYFSIISGEQIPPTAGRIFAILISSGVGIFFLELEQTSSGETKDWYIIPTGGPEWLFAGNQRANKPMGSNRKHIRYDASCIRLRASETTIRTPISPSHRKTVNFRTSPPSAPRMVR